MINLLWKEFWQNSRVLLAIGIVAAGPYAIYLILLIVQMFRMRDQHVEVTVQELGTLLLVASGLSMYLTILLAAFLGGNAVAGERADRSAEFAACLPISPGKAVASKAIVAAGACFAIWAVDAAVFLIAGQLASPGHFFDPRSPFDPAIIVISLVGVVGLFGLAWLFSSLLRSPAISAAAALGTGLTLAFVVRCFLPWEPLSNSRLISLLSLPVGIGVLCFASGVFLCLRRVEP
jgi:ABC-type transport system involved in multi-copper enzyme maturation permease subunit